MASARPKPVLTVQVDVDTVGRLLGFYGVEASTRCADDAAYRLALPRFAALFETLGMRATFFVVGDDLSDAAHRDVVGQLHAAGHEIGNHTQTHDYHFLRLSRPVKRNEIAQAGQVIEGITGRKPVGFRAPGYAVDGDVLEILTELGYCYDSSIMPSVLNVPMKLFHLLVSGKWNASGYGSTALSLAPNHAYRPDLRAIWRARSTGPLWEIPVSCVPYLRLPFYANFNLFTGDALFRLSAALTAARDCNYVFHAVEMLDPSELDPRIHCHPNARLPLANKVARCRHILEALRRGRRVMLSSEFAAELEQAAADSPPQLCTNGASEKNRKVGQMEGRQVPFAGPGDLTEG